MLVWSRSGRAAIWAFGALLIGLVYGAPVLVIGFASIAGHWNGVWPSDFTLRHYADAMRGASGRELWASFVTGVIASGLAMVSGTCAALGLRHVVGLSRRWLDLGFFAPSAVPSVSVGLGLLVAFSKPPVLLNGTTAIIIIAHFVLISAFTYGAVSAGLARLAPEFEQIAESLGARPSYRLRRVTLPLLAPYLVAAFSLSFALSMGELGATVMVYPPGWVTLPVGIFALTDRGAVFNGAALTMVLIAATLLVLGALSWVANRFAPRSA